MDSPVAEGGLTGAALVSVGAKTGGICKVINWKRVLVKTEKLAQVIGLR